MVIDLGATNSFWGGLKTVPRSPSDGPFEFRKATSFLFFRWALFMPGAHTLSPQCGVEKAETRSSSAMRRRNQADQRLVQKPVMARCGFCVKLARIEDRQFEGLG